MRIESIELRFYQIPTSTEGEPQPESDGTAEWDNTGVLVVHVRAGGVEGLGYAYTSPAALTVARETLAGLIVGSDHLATTKNFWQMVAAVRNIGWPGVSASAISAIDVALHDLKARTLEVSLLDLEGAARDRVMAYGSGGFTSYSVPQLQRQLAAWAAEGLRAVKMKVGTHPADDPARVTDARAAIPDTVELFVDANGAYSRKQALGLAERFAPSRVTWFEEPVSSDDLTGLRMLRDRGPAGMQIAAGEYGYLPASFHRLLATGAVDTLQADATRCGGVTGFRLAAAMATGAGVPLSAHTAPAIHASLASALPNVVHVEYFHDHVLVEGILFDGVPRLDAGDLVPDRTVPGHGLTLKDVDAEPYLVASWRAN
ncbi:MAG: mandelate racemase [Acidobacteria bacterium]|nr:mandelate racemase [Acidobacteriota bacterium]